MRDRLAYLGRSAVRRLLRRGSTCPSCGANRARTVARKYLVTQLVRCEHCRLLFRTPTDEQRRSAAYYQSQYESGFTTTMPGEAELAALLDGGFAGSPKDFRRYLAILDVLDLPAGARVLDYGCSWGYGVWQLQRAGYQAAGFELSRPRARFGRESLGVDVKDQVDALGEGYDVILSTHVFEHIPALGPCLDDVCDRLASGGYLVSITPNGHAAYRQRNPGAWQRSWGLKHPLLLDPDFWQQRSQNTVSYLSSEIENVAAIARWREGGAALVTNCDGAELLYIQKAGEH